EVAWKNEHVRAHSPIERVVRSADQSRESIGSNRLITTKTSTLHRRGWTDMPVAIEVLIEARLERLQCGAAPRHRADIRDVVAVGVGGPHRVLIGARNLPGNFIATSRFLCANRRPSTGLTSDEICTGKL